MRSIGQLALLSVLGEAVETTDSPFRVIVGKVGSMGIEKMVWKLSTACAGASWNSAPSCARRG
ncbi:MAG: hypothetical protein AB1556_17770 [Bacillota bacterium]